MEEMDPRILQALKSRDPEERKKAVKALAQIHTQEALRYLATIYKTDPDPDVRELAIKAGRHVKKSRAEGEWFGESKIRSTDEVAQAKPASKVSAVNQEQAKGLMDKALNESIQGNYDKAEEYARKAFQLNPDLQHDSYYAGIASEVMGMSTEEAIAELLRGME